MKFKSINDLSSLKGQSVMVKEKTGTIVEIENNKIYIQLENDKKSREYSLDNLKNETIKLRDSDIEHATLLYYCKEELNSSDSPLFNSKVIDDLGEKVSDDQQKNILDQWRMVVESAMQVSSRRQSTNNLFITILTILIGGVLFSDALWGSDKILQLIVSLIVSIFGVFICWEWMAQTKYYGELNDIKYSAVRDMEKYLPVQYFNAENVYFYNNYLRRKSFSDRERRIPIGFLIVFASIIIVVVVRLCGFLNENNKSTESATSKKTIICTEASMAENETTMDDIGSI